MDPTNPLIAAMYELLDRAREMFGDKVKSFWFNDTDNCPNCLKQKIQLTDGGKDSLQLSLNSFIYHDMNVMIIYLLCGRCLVNLTTSRGKKQKELYKSLEDHLKKAYHDYLSSIAS